MEQLYFGREEVDDSDINLIAEEEGEIAEIPAEQRKLRLQAYDKSVSDLVNMIRNGDIIFSPEYQRNYIWDNRKASLLVESILLNIPIPVIYASEEEDSAWNIVDGLQRLNALKRFYDNNFKLSGLEVLKELNGVKYDDLNPKAKRMLNNGNLRVILIFNDSNPEIKYDIFMRLNTGSVKLNEQELRNCLYRGSLNDMIKELRKNKKFLSILGLKAPHKRMNDCELILRYLAFSENYDKDSNKIIDYKGSVKPYLNSFMKRNSDAKDIYINNLREKFNNTIDKVYEVFGENAFRKLNDDEYENKLNRAIMDVIMIGFEKYSLEEIKKNKARILDLYKNILKDPNFNILVTQATSDTKVIEKRMKSWTDMLAKVMRG
ncbi:DUF262 domain-containing protein [Clostridium butyricum]|uniref:GmrSD restriction endonuclease domain-containing protein n=1 Tax=Clostridium butyricum TaxID=1492 RepID=UPI00232F9555|nr:DUF262 domain-containing protein [Clostridium butyricum]MDB2158983.1 DUF262 domain-containing protein [Clostridium butyricum]